MENKNTKEITVKMSAILFSHLKQMSDRFGTNLSETIRDCIKSHYEDFERKMYGYKGAALSSLKVDKLEKNTAEQARIDQLRAMSADELWQYLFEVGYFTGQPDEFGIQERIVKENGELCFYQIRGEEGSTDYYSRKVFGFNELIADLKKNKKLL